MKLSELKRDFRTRVDELLNSKDEIFTFVELRNKLTAEGFDVQINLHNYLIHSNKNSYKYRNKNYFGRPENLAKAKKLLEGK